MRQYAELKEQAASMDAAELMDARLDIRKEHERSAIDRVKAAYGEKFDPATMAGSRKDVASLLHEEAEIRSVREQLLRSGISRYRKDRNPGETETAENGKLFAGVHFERCAPAFLRSVSNSVHYKNVTFL